MNLTKSKAVKFATGFVGVAVALTFAITPMMAGATSATDLQAQINSLMATIQSLQSQLSATTGGTATTGYTFNTNLTVGSKGVDVMNLQKVLNMSADTKLAGTGAGSPGMETSTFGPATKAAVMKFQAKYGISPVAGYVGALTRAKLNTMSGSVVVVPPPAGGGTVLPTGGALTVTAGTQPTNSLAPTSAARVPFTTFTVTAGSADVTVNSVTVQRSGLAQDAVFAGVVLLDQNGLQIGIAKTLNSNHQAMVGEPFVVKAGTSMTLTVAGNMASSLSSYAGQVAGLDVVAINTTASVAGSLPITGASQTINASLTLGSVSLNTSSFDPGSTQSEPIGTTGYKFSGMRFTAGSAEQIKLWSVRWNQSGSASSNDLANVVTYVNGTAYPTTVSADGKYYTSLFPGGLLIDKGNSIDVYVQGDIVGSGAAGRTVKFDIYKTTDVYFSGVTYGYGVTPPAGGNSVVTCSSTQACGNFTTGTPWFQANLVNVSAGSVTAIQKAVSVAAQNIAVNVPNQVLGGYDVEFKGEPVTVQSHVFHFATTSAASGYLTNVTIVDQNGAIVAGPVDAVAEATSGQKVTFTDTVTYPVGKHTYTLKGKVSSSAANGAVITASTAPVTDWTNITGQTTGNTVALTTTTFNMNPVTVKSAALAVSMSTTPTAQRVVAGGQGVTFANIQLDATQSGEDVRFSSIKLAKTFSLATYTDLTGCQLFDGTTALNTGSNIFNPAAAGAETIVFDSSLTLAKGSVKTLTLKCNVATVASGTYLFTITPSVTNPATTGVTSGATVTATGAVASSQTMTVGTGSFTTSTGTSASYLIAAGGSTGNVLGTIRFHATNEDINLNHIGLALTNTASSSASDIVQVTLWDGLNQIGTATFLGSNTSATTTLATSLLLPKDTDKDITVKVDLAQVGTSQAGTEGALISVDSNASTDTLGTDGTGVSSGATKYATGSSAFAGIRLFKSYPVIVRDTSLNTSGVTDGALMRFKVTATGATSGIGINQFKFTLSTTSATVTAVNLFGYSDAGYSQGISGFTSGQIASSNYNPTGSSGAVTITPSSIIEIPGGQTYYFELRGTVTGGIGGASAYSVNTTLAGSSSYSTGFTPGTYSAGGTALMATSSAFFLGANNFVWSPNATTSTPATYADWTNGFGVQGLPSSGLSNNRTQ